MYGDDAFHHNVSTCTCNSRAHALLGIIHFTSLYSIKEI